jgi:hypothetical protein
MLLEPIECPTSILGRQLGKDEATLRGMESPNLVNTFRLLAAKKALYAKRE